MRPWSAEKQDRFEDVRALSALAVDSAPIAEMRRSIA